MTQHVLTTWSFDPLALAFLLLVLGAYLYVIGPLRQRLQLGEPVSSRRRAAFVAGWALLALITFSPLQTIARQYLFTAHAVQLFVLITGVAPLMMVGLPEWLVARLVPLESLRQATRSLVFPVIAFFAFNGIVIAWHIGPLYESALHHLWLYDVQLLCILLAGMINWWPLLTPLDRHTRLASPFQVLYLAVESVPLDLFGIAMLFSQVPFYSTYVHAARILPLSALVDQQIAGGIVAVPNNMIDFVVMSVIFFGWLARMERSQSERDRAEAEREEAEREEAERAKVSRTTEQEQAAPQ